MGVEFKDYSIDVKKILGDNALAYLEEAGGEVESQAARNTRIKTGHTKGSWAHKVDGKEMTCTVGSPLENAIWEEFGTGEYALAGDGRKGGWAYYDDDGVRHFTHGKKPTRALFKAFEELKPQLIKQAEQTFKE